MRMTGRVRNIINKLVNEGWMLEWSQGNIGGGYAIFKEGDRHKPVITREMGDELLHDGWVALDETTVDQTPGRMVYCVTEQARAALGARED